MKIKISEDKELVQQIRNKIKQNGGYCPCKTLKTDENKCICMDFLKQSIGPCHCGLYIKTEQ